MMDAEAARAFRACAAFAALRDALHRKAWVVYAKAPFGGAEQVFRCLGRYTHRVGISNHRLLRLDERGVCFRTRGDKHVTLAPEEFLRRSKDWREHLARLTGIDLARCPRCGHGPRLRVALDLFEPSTACTPPDTS